MNNKKKHLRSSRGEAVTGFISKLHFNYWTKARIDVMSVKI